MNSVFSYKNYRAFLKDYYLAQKRATAGFSYRRFSEMAKLNSANYLKLVIDGKRNLTGANIHQFARAIGMGFDETRYFEALVWLDQSSDRETRSYYKKVLQNWTLTSKPMRLVRNASKEVLSEWYFPAVLICLQGAAHGTEADEIADRLGLSPQIVSIAIVRLKKLGLISIRDGKVVLNEDFLVYHDRNASSVTARKFLREQLALSGRAFDLAYDKGAKFLSQTFSVPESDYAYYVDQLTSLLDEFAARSNSGPIQELVQLNIQLFPVKRAVSRS